MTARVRAVRRASSAAFVAMALSAAAAPSAWAETRRIAVLVGSNVGDAAHAPLRYAEQDAARLAAVLGELGGLAPGDVLLLRAPTPELVRAALEEAARRVATWHADKRGQAVLLFYYSGHSDGQVLELGGQALPFPEVRRRLAATGADVRLVIVDSCRSGALLALKGGRLGQAFDIRLADDLASTGEAFIASSAADESALESSEIGASFFSHHFISGLRGAADLSGDGLVTLAEAYQYAFARTLRATSETTIGPQHAAYDYHLAGRGDLVLTELLRPSAVLDLPSEFDRLLLVASVRLEVVAELGPRSAHRIAVGPGEYQLRAWRGTQAFAGRVNVGQGQELKVAEADLRPTLGAAVSQKGDAGDPEVLSLSPPLPEPIERGPWAVTAAAGVTEGIAEGASLGVLRAGAERSLGHSQRLAVLLMAGTGRAPGMRENRFGAALLPSLWTGGGRARAGIGLGVGGGVAQEHADAGQFHWSGLAWVSPTVSLELRLAHTIAVGAGGELSVAVLRRDDRIAVTGLPSAWIGLSRSF
jgi:hypothetical protein